MTYEHFILQCDSLANEGVTADFAAMSDFRPFLNLHKRANLGVIPDFTTVKVDKTKRANAFAEPDSRGNLLMFLVAHAPLFRNLFEVPVGWSAT